MKDSNQTKHREVPVPLTFPLFIHEKGSERRRSDFSASRKIAMLPHSSTGLTFSPQTNPASPAVKTLRAALMSRSWTVRHSGHLQLMTPNGTSAIIYPQSLHRLVEGNHRLMPTRVRPYQSDLYSSCLTNSDQLASLIDFATFLFLNILLTARLSMAITWFSFISRVESLFKKSLRLSAILACSRATLIRALFLFEEPFCFLAKLRCNFASLVSFLRNVLGATIFSPVERIAKWVSPKSIPILPVTIGLGVTLSSHIIDTKYLSAESFDTVTVTGVASFGIIRDQVIANGLSILANINSFPSHLNPLVVYEALWWSCLDLKDGYCDFLAKKLANAACKCLKDCWRATALTLLSHGYRGDFFNLVRSVEVS